MYQEKKRPGNAPIKKNITSVAWIGAMCWNPIGEKSFYQTSILCLCSEEPSFLG